MQCHAKGGLKWPSHTLTYLLYNRLLMWCRRACIQVCRWQTELCDGTLDCYADVSNNDRPQYNMYGHVGMQATYWTLGWHLGLYANISNNIIKRQTTVEHVRTCRHMHSGMRVMRLTALKQLDSKVYRWGIYELQLMEVERRGTGVGCRQSNMRVTIQTIASIVQACRSVVYEP